MTKLSQAQETVQGSKTEAYAQWFLESLQNGPKQQQSQEGETSTTPADINNNSEDTEKSTATRTILMDSKHLISFPPDFESIQCKPLLFDLALGECEFPSLEQKKKTAAKGFWGFWKS